MQSGTLRAPPAQNKNATPRAQGGVNTSCKQNEPSEKHPEGSEKTIRSGLIRMKFGVPKGI